MGFIDDPVSGIVGTILTHGLEKTVLGRLTLILEMAIGAVTSFLITCGGFLLVSSPAIGMKALGAGMVAAGVAIFATVQASPEAKGLTVSFSQKVANEKLDNPTTTIQRSK